MSYTIHISGHLEGSAKTAKKREQALLDKVTKFVAEIDGVDGATFNGGEVGMVNVTEPDAEASLP